MAVVAHTSIQIEMKHGAQAQGQQMFGCDHRRELLSKYAIMRCRKDGNKTISQEAYQNAKDTGDTPIAV